METTGKKRTKISKYEIRYGVRYNYLDLKKECFKGSIFSVYGYYPIKSTLQKVKCRYCSGNIFSMEREYYKCNRCSILYILSEEDIVIFLKSIRV